mgnify:FL=1
MSKLQDFSEMLHIQHLDVPHLRGRETGKDNNCDDEPEQEPVEGKRRFGEEDESETGVLGNGEKKADKVPYTRKIIQCNMY